MKNLGIICGGYSSEYDISLKSARNIAANFPADYKPYLIELCKEGWYVLEAGERIPFDPIRFTFSHCDKLIGIDLALIYIHGDPGENGKVQAFLDLIGKPYLNSGPLASELSFDKWYCNQFLKGFGIRVADSVLLKREVLSSEEAAKIKALGLPVFVKPCDSGSSYGIAKVNSAEELKPAITAAFKEGQTVVVEGFLSGTEVTCGIYQGLKGIQALPLTEIVSKKEFFDYEAKYLGLSDEITPARVSDSVRVHVQELAIQIYQLLNLRSIARIDFMLVDDVPYVIEVNTTPGFSDASIVPKMLTCAGISVNDFWADILNSSGY